MANWYRRFLILLTTINSLWAIAQPYASNKASFNVDQNRGCAPLTINITQLIGNTYVAQYDYKDGTPITLSKTHTFTQPGVYIIQAIYNNTIPSSTDNLDGITITVTQNIQPAFDISSCSAGKVSIKVNDTNYQQYFVDFDNNGSIDNTIAAGGAQTASYQYLSLTSQTITVRGHDLNGADNCSKKSGSFTPVAALPAATINTLAVSDATSIQLAYTPSTNIQYKAVVATDNASTFQQFQLINSTSNSQQLISLSGLAADTKYYCFRINAYDPCNNTNVTSNTICSAQLNLNLVSNSNNLSWSTSTNGVTDFTIKKDNTNYSNTVATSYNDTAPAITCNKDYCYTIITNYANGSNSTSLEKCGKSFSTDIPTAIQDGSAIVEGSNLNLSWEQDPAFSTNTYNISRAQGSSSFSSIGTSKTATYTDNPYSSQAEYCYQINYIDVCANASGTGVAICPIRLSGSSTTTNIKLDWSAFSGWKKGVKRYRIEKHDVGGTLLKTIYTTQLTVTDNTIDPDHQILVYKVVAEPKDATLTESVSNEIRIEQEPQLFFPTAFSPNKDGLNDLFPFKAGQFDDKLRFVESMTLQIFDRWGTLLYYTEKNEPWDGTNQGRVLTESTYIWRANIVDQQGKHYTKIGSVALLHVSK